MLLLDVDDGDELLLLLLLPEIPYVVADPVDPEVVQMSELSKIGLEDDDVDGGGGGGGTRCLDTKNLIELFSFPGLVT